MFKVNKELKPSKHGDGRTRGKALNDWKRQKSTIVFSPNFHFHNDRSLSSIILQILNAIRRCWSISPLNGWKRQKVTTVLSPHFPEGGACLRSHYANDPKWSVFYLMSYTSVPMTGSNFGNFFNGALKDFEAKQASRIRVRVWEFLWVIFLRNV